MTGLTRRRRKGVPGPVSGYDVGCSVIGFTNPSPPVLVIVNVLMVSCLLFSTVSSQEMFCALVGVRLTKDTM